MSPFAPRKQRYFRGAKGDYTTLIHLPVLTHILYDAATMTRTAQVLAFILCCHTATAATLFVSPKGNDTNSGLGPGDRQAVKTIQAGVDRRRPGDTLLLRGGVYRETVAFPRSGEPGQPLVVKAYQGEKVVVSGCDPITGWTLPQGKHLRQKGDQGTHLFSFIALPTRKEVRPLPSAQVPHGYPPTYERESLNVRNTKTHSRSVYRRPAAIPHAVECDTNPKRQRGP